MSTDVEISNLEFRVVEAAVKWYREHGYIPELAATHYEKPLIESTKELIAAREKAEGKVSPIGSPN